MLDMCFDRKKLIHLALLLGSDYTLGIKGVGIVNASEIIQAFDDIDGLKRFKAWGNAADEFLDNS